MERSMVQLNVVYFSSHVTFCLINIECCSYWHRNSEWPGGNDQEKHLKILNINELNGLFICGFGEESQFPSVKYSDDNGFSIWLPRVLRVTLHVKVLWSLEWSVHMLLLMALCLFSLLSLLTWGKFCIWMLIILCLCLVKSWHIVHNDECCF